MNNHDETTAMLKIIVAWIGAIFGSITLQHVVLFATLIFTVLQTYVLVRDKVLKREKQ